MHLCCHKVEQGTGSDEFILLSLLSLLLLKIMIIFHRKSSKIQNTSEDIWFFFPNKRLLSNAILPNSMQGAIIEFSNSTPEQWTEQTNEMPKADENLVSEAPMGHGVKHWED